jgi:hypothetical protein
MRTPFIVILITLCLMDRTRHHFQLLITDSDLRLKDNLWMTPTHEDETL